MDDEIALLCWLDSTLCDVDVVSALLTEFIEPLQQMRFKADMVKIFPKEMKMEEIFGLGEPAIIRVLESVGTAANFLGFFTGKTHKWADRTRN
jgi:hypothetical protein